MILQSTTESVPFTPPWLEGTANPRTYFLRAGSVIERASIEAELSGEYRAGEVWPFELYAKFEAGAKALFSEEDAATVCALAEQERANEKLSDEDRAVLVTARDVLAENWPDYKGLLKQQERRNELVPVLAFRRFCTGWTGLDAEFSSVAGLVTDKALQDVPPLDLRTVGLQAFTMLYAGGQAKNFVAPSRSRAARATSNSGASSMAGGRSARTTGKKTRQRQSPRASSK